MTLRIPPRAVFLAAFSLAATLLGAQDPPSARLRVTCVPPAELSLNHAPQGAGESWNLTLPPDAPALLRLSAPGYRTQWRTVTLGPGDRRHEPFRLEREPIPVLFRANAKATVLCDGAELGVTPLTHFFQEPKTYRVVFRAPGFQEHALALRLADGKPHVVDAVLLSDSGTLRLTSEPAGARVLINGVEKGVTPCTLSRIREGEHTLTLRLGGHKPLTHTLTLVAGETVPLDFRLERLPAGLTVTTLPEGARVYVDGAYRGDSDLTLTDLSAGQHALRVELPGHAPETRAVTLASGATQVEEFRLRIVRGTLAVRTQPAAVTVWQGVKRLLATVPEKDGDYTSRRAELALPPGTYELTFKANGYHDATRKVTIAANATAELNVRLDFAPDFELVTRTETHRGVLVRQSPEGNVTLELKPGAYRTFTAEEIVRGRFLRP